MYHINIVDNWYLHVSIAFTVGTVISDKEKQTLSG